MVIPQKIKAVGWLYQPLSDCLGGVHTKNTELLKPVSLKKHD